MNRLKPPAQGDFIEHLFARRTLIFSGLIILALIAFEIFNFSTTEFAFEDLLGDIRFVGIRWSIILALAFCSIDFAGIARLFMPNDGYDDVQEQRYLFGAWIVAATMNALLTWWGVSIALLNHVSLGNGILTQDYLLKSVPIFVSIMVWLSRILLIGTFSIAGDKLFSLSAEYQKNINLPLQRKSGSKISRNTNNISQKIQPGKNSYPRSSNISSPPVTPQPMYTKGRTRN